MREIDRYDIEALQKLANRAYPDGTWGQVYHGSLEGNPVNIHGRIKRVRPWESGINYCAILAWLDSAPAIYEPREIDTHN